jgi:hypothetical protein
MSPCTLSQNHHGALSGPLPHCFHLGSKIPLKTLPQSLNPRAVAVTADCSLVHLNQRFGGTYCLRVQCRRLFTKKTEALRSSGTSVISTKLYGITLWKTAAFVGNWLQDTFYECLLHSS